VLIRRATLEAIRAGEVTLAFRRLRRPTVRAGGRLRTAVGELAIVAIERTSERAVTAADARRAGFASRAALLESLAGRTGELYRIELAFRGADPRVALRARDDLDPAERDALRARLDRLDARADAPWTRALLRAIERAPGTRAAVLARAAGEETPRWKRRVRRLKELGLTESLDVGYRLSPRGNALLAALGGASS
jgi:hypothetical protein